MPSSSITVSSDGSDTVVRLSGEIDVALRDEASAALAQVAVARGSVVLDLTDARLVGATGLAFVVQCRRACTESGVPFEVRHVPPAVARVFAALDLAGELVRDTQDAEPVA
jgi:anti-sigma B factor antagonist